MTWTNGFHGLPDEAKEAFWRTHEEAGFPGYCLKPHIEHWTGGPDSEEIGLVFAGAEVTE